MPVDSTFFPVRAELAAWLHEQAEDEDLTPEALLDRCVERERRRLIGKDVDPRTRRPGVTPNEARLKPGELDTTQMAEAVGVSVGRLRDAVRAGIVVPARPGERGHGHVFHSRQCVGVAILLRLPLARPMDDLVLAQLQRWTANVTLDACRKDGFVVYRALVASALIVAGRSLASALEKSAEPATVIALEPIGAMLAWLDPDRRRGDGPLTGSDRGRAA